MNIPKIFKLANDTSILPSPYWSSAQLIFETWLKENGKIVYGHLTSQKTFIVNFSDLSRAHGDTHQALLICIEPIEKKECEHEYVEIKVLQKQDEKITAYQHICSDCGKKLKAKWEIVE